MQERIRRFRELADEYNEGRHVSGYRYPPELRREAVALAREASAHGMSRQALVQGLGITAPTLLRWMEQDPPLFREVNVSRNELLSEPSRSSTLSLVTPSGYRIEGLAFPQIRQLLESLT